MPNLKVCDVKNGKGEQIWDPVAKKYKDCQLKICNTAFYPDGIGCIKTPKSCVILKGYGESNWNTISLTWGKCKVKSCEKGYHIEGNECKNDKKVCLILNGEGEQLWDPKVKNYGNCLRKSCDKDYYPDGNLCSPSPKTCPIANGVGESLWNLINQNWNSCKIKICNKNFHENNNKCVPNIKPCSVANGKGEQSFDPIKLSWGSCKVKVCNTGYQRCQNKCFPIQVGKFRPIYPIPPTVQKKCYDDKKEIPCPESCEPFYDQDGNHPLFSSYKRFEDMGDGTVWDLILKGYWQKCNGGLSGKDCKTGTPLKMNWSNAVNYCKNLSLAGMSKWRIPDAQEVRTLLDISKNKVPLTFLDDFPNSQTNLWTITVIPSNSAMAWYTTYKTNEVIKPEKYQLYPVRCFSNGNPKSIVDRMDWQDQGNGVVIEKLSRLRLTKCPMGFGGTSCTTGSMGKYTWQEALKNCQDLTLDGRRWRLPSRYEMAFYIDHDHYAPAVKSTKIFPKMIYESDRYSWVNNRFWTASTWVMNPVQVWLVNTTFGANYYDHPKTKLSKLPHMCISEPLITDTKDARPIEVASSNPKRCLKCSDWTKASTCTNAEETVLGQCPSRGQDSYGQEASLPESAPLVFLDLKNGVVLDLNTGKHWIKCGPGYSGSDCKSGSSKELNHSDAVTYCDQLTLAGFSDWRLPEMRELLMIQDYRNDKNAPIDRAFFKNFPMGKNLWSATLNTNQNTKILTANAFASKTEEKTLKNNFLCVRGPKYKNELIVETNKPIVDRSSNLMWQKCSAGQVFPNCSGTAQLYTWKEAITYCESINNGGFDNWKLPAVRELQTLLDFSKKSAIAKEFINNPEGTFWTSTPRADSGAKAWAIKFSDYGQLINQAPEIKSQVRCVRYGP